jgi:nucleolar protein 56
MAPNIASVAGPVLAAKLISKAGGMRKLAKLPASTVQVLGAEKALFRALRKGAKPPKHGMIFEHPLINQAPRNLRGRLARLLASKITIASRVDAFGADDRSGELKEELETRVAEIYQEEGKEAP